MVKINFINNVTKANADTFNTMQDNIENAINEKQATIDSSHKLSADLVDDTSTTNKFFSGDYNDLSNKPIVLEPTVLYNNDTGTNSTAILSNSAANYDYIEIYFKNNDGFYASQKVYEPNGKSVCLTSTFTGGSNYVLKFAGATISGTSITIDDYWEFNLNGASRIDPGNAYITKVVGYK